MTFVDFQNYHRKVSWRKLYTVNLTYFSKVKDSNGDLLTVANAHTSLTSASTDSNRDLITAANAHSSVANANTAVVRVAS